MSQHVSFFESLHLTVKILLNVMQECRLALTSKVVSVLRTSLYMRRRFSLSAGRQHVVLTSFFLFVLLLVVIRFKRFYCFTTKSARDAGSKDVKPLNTFV